MAVTNITPIPMLINTMSSNTTDAAGGAVVTTPADGFVIAMAAGDLGGKGTPESLLVKFVAPAGGDTITIQAGAKPPSERAGLGNLPLVLGASEVRYIVLEGSRFSQADGTIKAICTALSRCTAFGMPRDSGRGGG